MLATLWGRPQATFASKVEINGSVARVTREVDAGLEVLDVDLPAVITTDLRLNEPRFIKLPDIMKAKSKPLETLQFAELGVDTGHMLKTTSLCRAREAQQGRDGEGRGRAGRGAEGQGPGLIRRTCR
jgi:electron transfer flavoprotein beta subunit